MRTNHLLVPILVLTLGFGTTHGQLMNKLKQKAANKIENAADKKLGTGNQQAPGGRGNSGAPGSGNNNPSNTEGGGLITTPPDVGQHIADATNAYQSGKYGEARYAVQQAMLGVEMEIGNQVLQSLPESIIGLNKQAASDKVTSTGFGWVGLTVQREYNDQKNKEFRVMVANNSAWMSAVNMYMNSSYAQTTGGEQNWKQTKVNGHRAIIEYSKGSGYKLSVPLGQSSLIVFEGVNFASESDMMKAAEVIDIDGIKKMLGEKD